MLAWSIIGNVTGIGFNIMGTHRHGFISSAKKSYWGNLSSIFQICIVFASRRNRILVSMHIAKEQIVPLRLEWAILHMRQYCVNFTLTGCGILSAAAPTCMALYGPSEG